MSSNQESEPSKRSTSAEIETLPNPNSSPSLDPLETLPPSDSSDHDIRGSQESKTHPDHPGNLGTIQGDHTMIDSSILSRSAQFSNMPRFVVERFHAKGGLGQVSIAHDNELNRRVALKEILPEQASNPSNQERFILEAEITGQLEHPGVVPVYGMGVNALGQPFYAMRFIEGENLKVAIARIHGQTQSNSRNGRFISIELRSLLNRFVSVCQTIEYAHSRKVLHRDLKPDNILLGPYGETLVVDWGLAKAGGTVTESPGIDSTLKPVLLRSGSNSETIDGSAIGTPSYMSPEQARGEIASLGPATDIYALGATLYSILTGKPPYQGRQLYELLEHVRAGDFPRPRSVNPQIPKPLESICLKAMSLKPSDRYARAVEIGKEIELWMGDEPISSYSETYWERGSRFARKNRTFVAAMITILLATIGLFGLSTWFLSKLEIARKERDYKALEVATSKLRELDQRFYATANAIKERSTSRSPGWAWKNEQELESIAQSATNQDKRKILREELARAWMFPDIRRRGTILQDMVISNIQWSQDGSLIALGQNTATAGSVHITILDAENYQVRKQLKFLLSFSNLWGKAETDGIKSIGFSPDGSEVWVGTRAGEIVIFNLLSDSDQPSLRWKAHSDDVIGLGCSEDGKTIVSAGKDEKVIWWNRHSQDRKAVVAVPNIDDIVLHRDDLYIVADVIYRDSAERKSDKDPLTVWISENVRMLSLIPEQRSIVLEKDSELHFYSMDNGKWLRTLRDYRSNFRLGRSEIAAGAMGRFAAAHDGDAIKIWDTNSSDSFAVVNGEAIHKIGFDPNRPRLLVADSRRLDVYDVRIDPLWTTFSSYQGEATRMQVDPFNPRLLISFFESEEASPTTKIEDWSLDPLERKKIYRLPGVHAAEWAFSPSRNEVAFVHINNEIRSLSLEKDQSMSIQKPLPSVELLKYSRDGTSIAWTSRENSQLSLLGKVQPWTLHSYQLQSQSMFRWSNQLSQLRLNVSKFHDHQQSGLRLASVSQDSILRIWNDLENTEPIEIAVRSEKPNQLEWLGADDSILVGHRSGLLSLYDSRGTLLFEESSLEGSISDIAVGPEGYVAVGSILGEFNLYRWNGEALELLCRFGPFSNSVEQVAFSGNGRFLIVRIRGTGAPWILRFDQLKTRWEKLGL